jgi:hypothetical protein
LEYDPEIRNAEDAPILEGWARDLLAAPETTIRERLKANSDLLAGRSDLFDVLGTAEQAGKNRQIVLNLLLDTEAQIKAGQVDMLDAPAADGATR